jgi:UDP-N-acetylglucosamine acyltransferase
MNETQISPLAIVHSKAQIGKGTVIGPFCQIGENVIIGENCTLHSHVIIDGHTQIGNNNEIYQFTSIGTPPQDRTYKGEPTKTVIGDNNLFRESITVHRATTKEDHITSIGDNGYFMSGVHIAHDCRLGNNVTFASACMCAGHVKVGDFVIMGGQCGVSPFVTIGKGAFIGGASAVDRDIPHFCTAFGNRIKLKGINIVGLKRRGNAKENVSEVIEFYRIMESSAFSPRAFVERDEHMQEYKDNKIVMEIADFIMKSEIGIPPFMS